MKVHSHLPIGRFLSLLVLVLSLGLFAALPPVAHAGLNMEMDLVNENNFYTFYPILTTNSAAPAVPFGDYFVASPGWPTNGVGSLFQCDTNGFNQVPGGGNYGFNVFDAPDFNSSFIKNITNGIWSIFVTNTITTNIYHFAVTAGLVSNSMPQVVILYPPNNALNVTNQPTFLWQGGPTNYTDLVLYQDANNLNLPVTQTSYFGFTANPGLDGFNVHYDLLSTTAVVCSAPTNSAGSLLSSWVSTAHLQDLASSQFTVGSPVANFNADLGTTNLPWATMGDSAWFTETTNTYNGAPSADQSGSVTGSQASTLSVVVTGPGTLTYYWSTIANGGFNCEFDVDGIYSNSISGDTAWYQDGPYSIGPGQHILSWTSYANGDTDPTEAGFLDNVSYVAKPAPTLTVTALPQSGPVPLTVQFTSPAVDGNGNTVTNWYWTFGDGGTSQSQSPSHIYTSIGSYSPSLTAYSTFGATPLSVTGPGTITVTPPPPPTGNWTTTGSIQTSERFAFPLTVLPNGEVLASGGQAVFQIFSYAESDLYNPTNGSWQTTAGYMNYARQNHTTTLLTNGLVLAAGGFTAGLGGGPLATCELYSPATGIWTNTASMKTARSSHTAVPLTNGFVLVAGGISNSVTLASSELYNPAAGTWTSTGNLNTPRSSASAFLLTNGTVLVVGGQGTNGTTLASAEIYNPGTGLWRFTSSPMLASQYQPISLLLPNGQVLVAGGSTNGGTSVTGFSELYDPVTDSWRQTGSMNTPRESAGAVLLNNGIALVAGGSSGSSLTNAELYDPAGGFWTVTGAMLEGRNGPFPMVQLANAKALATGGLPANNDLSTGTTELYTTTLPTIRILNPIRLAGGGFQFSFTNTPGAGSTIFSTTNLSLSLSNWITLGSATEILPGQFQFKDPQATNGPRHFYRVRSP